MILRYCILVLLWILIILFLFLKAKVLFKQIQLPLFLLLAGTLANSLEIFIKGEVTDYFDLSNIGINWPVFNLADVLLFVGAIWLIINIFRKQKTP